MAPPIAETFVFAPKVCIRLSYLPPEAKFIFLDFLYISKTTPV